MKRIAASTGATKQSVKQERPRWSGRNALVELAIVEKVEIVAGNALGVFSGIWPHDTAWVAMADVAPSAASIARLARFDAARGLSIPPEQAAPLYVRDQVALTIDERRQVASASPGRPRERVGSSRRDRVQREGAK